LESAAAHYLVLVDVVVEVEEVGPPTGDATFLFHLDPVQPERTGTRSDEDGAVEPQYYGVRRGQSENWGESAIATRLLVPDESVDVEEDEVDLPLALVQLDQHQVANQKAGNVEESVDDNRTVEQYRRFDSSVNLKCLLIVLSP
jgi:hypothetical protein